MPKWMTDPTVDSHNGGASEARWRPAALPPAAAQAARLFCDNRLSRTLKRLFGLEQWDATLDGSVAQTGGGDSTSAWIEPILLEFAHPAGRLRVECDLSHYPMLAPVTDQDTAERSPSHGDAALRLAVASILVEPVLKALATLGLGGLKLAGLHRIASRNSRQAPLSADMPTVHVTFAYHGRIHTAMVILDTALLQQMQHSLERHYAATARREATGYSCLSADVLLPGRLVLNRLIGGDVILRAASMGATPLAPGRCGGPIHASVAWGTPGLTRIHAQVEIDGQTLSITQEPYMTDNIDPSPGNEALTAETRDEAICVGELELPIQLEVDTIALPLSDIYALRAGYVLELPSPAQAVQIKLVTHGRTIGYAELISVGEHLGAMFQPNELVGVMLIVLAIGIVPLIAIVVTSYTKIVVVLSLLRNALGAQQVPPNMVLNGIAILVSLYVMAPIGMSAMKQLQGEPSAGTPSQSVLQAFSAAQEPFRAFLKQHAKEREKRFFMRTAAVIWPKEMADSLHEDDFIVLAPAFTLSELTDAFKIGFLLYITFVIIDLIIANVLLAMGLNQVMPTNVAIPFKLLLFVVMDGWSTLLHGLILTYRHAVMHVCVAANRHRRGWGWPGRVFSTSDNVHAGSGVVPRRKADCRDNCDRRIGPGLRRGSTAVRQRSFSGGHPTMTRTRKPVGADHVTHLTAASSPPRADLSARRRLRASLYRGFVKFAHSTGQPNMQQRWAMERMRRLARMGLSTRRTRGRSRSAASLLEDDISDGDDTRLDTHAHIGGTAEQDDSNGGGGSGGGGGSSGGGDDEHDRRQRDSEQDAPIQRKAAGFRPSRTARRLDRSALDVNEVRKLAHPDETPPKGDTMAAFVSGLLDILEQKKKDPGLNVNTHIHQLFLDYFLNKSHTTKSYSLSEIIAMFANTALTRTGTATKDMRQGAAANAENAQQASHVPLQSLHLLLPLMPYSVQHCRSAKHLEDAVQCRQVLKWAALSHSTG
ncbi:hypothetical protein DFQ30_007219 [Apophysomyces sp. BC1015]|nr:hypothetical protein DFQ30_007219 [Apophysomyces sp. BC1015]